jgi:hypothetical protein
LAIETLSRLNFYHDEHDVDRSNSLHVHRSSFYSDVLHGFLKARRELLHHHDGEQRQQQEIERSMDDLQSECKRIIADAPRRRLRLQYERVEHVISKELQLFESQEQRGDCAEIVRRHNQHFQWNHFEAIIERHLQQLLGIIDDLHRKDTADCKTIGQA